MKKIQLVLALTAVVLFGQIGNTQDLLGIYPQRNVNELFKNGPYYETAAIYMTQATNRSVDPKAGVLTVSAKFADQQFENLKTRDVNEPAYSALMFGVSSNTQNKTFVKQAGIVALNNVGSPSDSYYQSLPGISVSPISASENFGFNQYISTEGLYGKPTNGTYYMGTVEYNFSRPVDNPVIHITGLGGYFSLTTGAGYQLPFSCDMELVTPGIAMRILNGTKADVKGVSTDIFVLDGNTLKSNYQDEYYGLYGKTGTSGEFSGTGSVLLAGTGISKVKFKIYMRGKTLNQEWTTPPVSVRSAQAEEYQLVGERYNVTFTLEDKASDSSPVDYASFDVVRSDDDALVKWTTAKEINNSHFIVERSFDGSAYDAITRIEGNGNATDLIDYSYNDEGVGSAYGGTIYYRLRQVDFDGTENLSQVKTVTFESSAKVSVFPNPSVDYVEVLTGNYSGDVKVVLFDLTGQHIRSYDKRNINIKDLAAETYIVRVEDEAGRVLLEEKLLKIK